MDSHVWTRRRNDERLVRDLQLRGTVYELLIKHSDEWLDAEKLDDSPALMRYALDVRQAFLLHGWQPRPSVRVPRNAAAKKNNRSEPSGC